MQGIKSELAICKARVLTAVLCLQSLYVFYKLQNGVPNTFLRKCVEIIMDSFLENAGDLLHS